MFSKIGNHASRDPANRDQEYRRRLQSVSGDGGKKSSESRAGAGNVDMRPEAGSLTYARYTTGTPTLLLSHGDDSVRSAALVNQARVPLTCTLSSRGKPEPVEIDPAR
ncbi:hypothetical protein Bbelb_336910 [Branchiostoma belcheri]|nr:hypothetical protein Bbelb_336910 [Branchiostoma belcheri]